MSLLSARVTVAYGNREVLRDARIELGEGEIVGLVGASGSGKSTLGLTLLGLAGFRGAKATGSILFDNENLLERSDRQWRNLRGRRIALVLQSASSALNPVLSVGRQLREAWRAHSNDSWQEALPWVRSLLEGVQLPSDDEFLRRLPRQISIGQAQRVLIAMGILHRPAVLIADEPTSALDPITQHEVLQLLKKVNRDFGISILCISHDLLALASFCDRVAILHQGEIVETAEPEAIFEDPQHPYTQQLVDALPRRMPARREERPMSVQWANEELA